MIETLKDPSAMAALWPVPVTPLLQLPRLAATLGIAKVWVKDETPRALGNFKSLGGAYAGLRALARAAGQPDIASLVAATLPPEELPTLICASDGNHGLAVAAGARLVRGTATIYLARAVSSERSQRILAKGARIVWVEGTYDDAVDAAANAARRGEGLLIADTTNDGDDLAVRDVMAGYAVMAGEIVDQLREGGEDRPTHLFIQAGVGGLAAAMVEGLRAEMDGDRTIVVVEPEMAACVSAALALGRPTRIAGGLVTVADMLSCGVASAPALEVLLACDATAIAVNEDELVDAVSTLQDYGNLTSTPSGAAGLAGLLAAAPGGRLAGGSKLDASSRALLIVTEGLPVDSGD